MNVLLSGPHTGDPSSSVYGKSSGASKLGSENTNLDEGKRWKEDGRVTTDGALVCAGDTDTKNRQSRNKRIPITSLLLPQAASASQSCPLVTFGSHDPMRYMSKVPVAARDQDMISFRHRRESQDYLRISQLSNFTHCIRIVGVQNGVATTISLCPHVKLAKNRRTYGGYDLTARAVRHFTSVVSW